MVMAKDEIVSLRKNALLLEREMLVRTRDNSPCCGITASQCHVLLEIEESGSTSVSGLASALGLDASSLSRAVDGLVEYGCVTRAENEDDRRFSRIALTAEGKKKVETIVGQFDDLFSSVLENIPEAGQRSVVEAVASLALILKKMRTGEPRSCIKNIESSYSKDKRSIRRRPKRGGK
jgi:DNA-binding MarR family transcriptional regulator